MGAMAKHLLRHLYILNCTTPLLSFSLAHDGADPCMQQQTFLLGHSDFDNNCWCLSVLRKSAVLTFRLSYVGL